VGSSVAGMDLQAGGYGEQLVAVLSAATDLLADLPARVTRLTGPDLDVVLPVIDRLAALAGAGRYTITADAESRGEITASQAGTTAQWVADRCPALDGRDAGLVAKAVRDLAAPELRTAAEAVAAGRLSVPAGGVVAAEWRQLEPLIEPDAGEAVLAGLVEMGGVDGPAGVRRLRPALLARYGLGAVLQDVEDWHAGLTVLSCGRDIGGGITEYRLRLNPEARTVVEAAINTASAPKVVGGVRDSRTVDQRRGDALIQVCRRATAETAMVTRAGTKATVIVTIGLDDLRHRTRPGVLVGGLDGGDVLGRRRCGGWPATPASSPPSWPGPGRSWTWAGTGARSPPPKSGRCGYETGTAPSPAAPSRGPGPTPTTSGTGPTAGPPTSTTARCCAVGTTPSSTATGSPPLSPTTPAAANRQECTSSGTDDPAATTRRWLCASAPSTNRPPTTPTHHRPDRARRTRRAGRSGAGSRDRPVM
jgi:Domain of unknown function (DUF222)